jgi:hypothetical protein
MREVKSKRGGVGSGCCVLRADGRPAPTSGASVSPTFTDSQWGVTEPLNAHIMKKVVALVQTFLVRTQV